MLATPLRRITAVWLLLVSATLFSWESAHVGHDHRLASSIVLLIAFTKARFVGLEFMELRAAPLPLRLIFEAWVVLACVALLILYWLSPSV
jgi:hypothetical protein